MLTRHSAVDDGAVFELDGHRLVVELHEEADELHLWTRKKALTLTQSNAKLATLGSPAVVSRCDDERRMVDVDHDPNMQLPETLNLWLLVSQIANASALTIRPIE